MASGDIFSEGTIDLTPPDENIIVPGVRPEYVEDEVPVLADGHNDPPAVLPDSAPPPIIIPDEEQAKAILTPEQEDRYYKSLESGARAVPGSGTLRLRGSIGLEAGLGSSSNVKLNGSSQIRELIGKAAGAQTKMSEFYNASAEVIYGENQAATGGWGSNGYGPSYDSGSSGNSSRYINAAMYTSGTSWVSVEYWIIIPWAKQPTSGTTVKLDYSFTHSGIDGRSGHGAIKIGGCNSNPGTFKQGTENNSQHRYYNVATLCGVSNYSYYPYSFPEKSWHENGELKTEGNGYTSRTWTKSTYFNWGGTYTYLAFQSRAQNYNGGSSSRATISYKLSEL